MDAENFCRKHQINKDDEEWKVVFEELTDPDDEEKRVEPFVGQVCPVCFMHLRTKVKDLKRRLKVESRQAVSLRSKADQAQEIVDAVVEVVREVTGKDALKLAKKTYPRKGQMGVPGFANFGEHGVLANILPNLIVEAVNMGKRDGQKKDNEA